MPTRRTVLLAFPIAIAGAVTRPRTVLLTARYGAHTPATLEIQTDVAANVWELRRYAAPSPELRNALRAAGVRFVAHGDALLIPFDSYSEREQVWTGVNHSTAWQALNCDRSYQTTLFECLT